MNDSTSGGWTCHNCGVWVNQGEFHICLSEKDSFRGYYTMPKDYSEQLAEIIDLLREISVKLDQMRMKPWIYRPK